jgi:molybdate transport system regulatory protein
MDISLRLRMSDRCAIGPGKIRLLESIDEHGSISAAGRAMKMSYRRAWILVDELNRSFTDPLVLTQLGGQQGGGATLTPLGHDVVRRYRAIERRIFSASRDHLAVLDSVAANGSPRSPR